MSLINIIIYFLFTFAILLSLYSLYKFELDISDNTSSGKILKFSALSVGFLFLIWYLNWFIKLLIRYINYSIF